MSFFYIFICYRLYKSIEESDFIVSEEEISWHSLSVTISSNHTSDPRSISITISMCIPQMPVYRRRQWCKKHKKRSQHEQGWVHFTDESWFSKTSYFGCIHFWSYWYRLEIKAISNNLYKICLEASTNLNEPKLNFFQ